MKKVSGYVSVRALGCYDFEFYVDDNATDEEIEEQVEKVMDISTYFSVEDNVVKIIGYPLSSAMKEKARGLMSSGIGGLF